MSRLRTGSFVVVGCSSVVGTEPRPSVNLPYVDFLQSLESILTMIADDRKPSRRAVLKMKMADSDGEPS
jgi:hypothetical protein